MNALETMAPPPSRFVPAAGNVLDRQTGLIWEQAPDDTPVSWKEAGASAPGWRLPSASELLLLLSGLPAEHPFPAPRPGAIFWSATESPFSAYGRVRAIGCQEGSLYVVRLIDKSAAALVWRVKSEP